MTEIDMNKLVADALKQTATIAEALELVARVRNLASTGAPMPVPAPVPVPVPATRVAAPAGPMNRHRRKWAPAEIERATKLVALGLSPADVGKHIGRTRSAVQVALAKGIIGQGVYQPSPHRVRGGYACAINLGREIKDYDRAQAAFDLDGGLRKGGVQ